MSKNEERLRDLSDSDRRTRGTPNESERTRDEPRELADDEDHRLALFRQRQFQSVLPNPPEMPGYRTIWLTTESPSDSIADRQSIGYQLVTWGEVRGWAHANANVEAQAGEPVRVKEMVLAKISERLWREYMHINHHEKPASQDEAILTGIENMNAQGRGKTSLVEEEGIKDIRSQMHKASPFRR